MPLSRSAQLLALCALIALALPASALAAPKMWTGFQDDQNFRWASDRAEVLDRAAASGTTIIRTTVEWAQVAPTRPARPGNPFEPAYRLDDLDEFVRAAEARGIEVLISIWGTPGWANGNRGKNVAPRKMKDLRLFARALARRYSGRFAGYPYVGFYSLWNEPNLNRFLAPQFDQQGRSVAPRIYAKMFRAAYRGIKAGNKQALVAIGETSPQGRDRPSPGSVSDSHSPGRFAQLVAQSRPRVSFDAYAHHPYSTKVRFSPRQRVRWPNVNWSRLARFERSIDRWFAKKEIPIWITEYGHQTRPERSGGLTHKQQAKFAKQALTIARRDPRIAMFIWFIYRDSPTQGKQWEGAGGLVRHTNAAKPSLARFRKIAKQVDPRNGEFLFRAGTRNPTLTVAARELKARNGSGTTIEIGYSLKRGKRPLGNGVARAKLKANGTVVVRPRLTVKRGKRYTLDLTLSDPDGNTVSRRLKLRSL